eukprot:13648900-Alexandrium_andersonii.AAC.1
MGSLRLSDVPHLDVIACVLWLGGRARWRMVLAEVVVELRNGLPKGLAIRRNAQGNPGRDVVDLEVRVVPGDGPDLVGQHASLRLVGGVVVDVDADL